MISFLRAIDIVSFLLVWYIAGTLVDIRSLLREIRNAVKNR